MSRSYVKFIRAHGDELQDKIDTGNRDLDDAYAVVNAMKRHVESLQSELDELFNKQRIAISAASITHLRMPLCRIAAVRSAGTQTGDITTF